MGEGSVMDSLGVEIIGVMSPVSICMLLVVLLVSALSPSPSSPAPPPPATITAATLVYTESPSDPPARRLGGALLNAAAFVVLVAAVTFLLLLLYYYNCTGFLRGYMRLSAFFVLASMGGSILLSLLRRAAIPLDAPSALLLLLNFSAVGVLAVLSSAVPILLRQAYTVALGVIVAAWFTQLPEWTTWTLLIALAVYDLVAVLAPKGPLKLLVELASSRDEELPALVYEARPTVSRPATAASSLTAVAASSSVELQPIDPPPSDTTSNSDTLIRRATDLTRSAGSDHSIVEIEQVEEETSLLVGNEPGEREAADSSRREHYSESDDELLETTRGIRLGLGDFVFYSVLVGRAAMYDLMTVYACYLAIISGLGCTLILLSVCRHALPALPISIMLGVLFYFLTRLLMEPFVVGASTGLVMF